MTRSAAERPWPAAARAQWRSPLRRSGTLCDDGLCLAGDRHRRRRGLGDQRAGAVREGGCGTARGEQGLGVASGSGHVYVSCSGIQSRDRLLAPGAAGAVGERWRTGAGMVCCVMGGCSAAAFAVRDPETDASGRATIHAVRIASAAVLEYLTAAWGRAPIVPCHARGGRGAIREIVPGFTLLAAPIWGTRPNSGENHPQ